MSQRPIVAVLGLGTVGASLAKALRSTGSYGAVIAWDPSYDSARAAQRAQVADRFPRRASEAIQNAALVLLALGGNQFLEALTEIAPVLGSGVVVCSVVEAQEHALILMERHLPHHVSLVCADPISWGSPPGEERTDPDPDAFKGGVWCIASASCAHSDAVGFVAQAGDELGMTPYFLDAREHDAFVAGLHLLPSVVAASIVQVVTAQTSWREMSRLAGVPFRTLTAEPLLDPSRQPDLPSWREHVIRWIDLLTVELTRLRAGLEDGREPPGLFEDAWQARLKWLRERDIPAQAREAPTVDAPRRRFPF